MIINSDDLFTPEADVTVYVRQLKIENVNEILVKRLNEYLKKKKCAYWVYLSKIETLNNDMEVFEKAHYCLIIKADNKKFNYSRDAQALFDIMEPFLRDDANIEKFVDVSVIGWQNTIQFDYKKEDCVVLYSI